MNFPIRFALFGSLVTLLAIVGLAIAKWVTQRPGVPQGLRDVVAAA